MMTQPTIDDLLDAAVAAYGAAVAACRETLADHGGPVDEARDLSVAATEDFAAAIGLGYVAALHQIREGWRVTQS